MNAVFYGICTHFRTQAFNQQRRIAFPDGRAYDVNGQEIPSHVAMLSIFRNDVNAELPDEAIDAFQGSGDELIRRRDGDTITWEIISPVVLGFDGMPEALQLKIDCLPRLGEDVLLDGSLLIGDYPDSVIALVDVTGGSLFSVDQPSGGRHAVLSADISTPWSLEVQRRDGSAARSLELKPDAHVTISNHARITGTCDECDYLLHYRLTNQKNAPKSSFSAPKLCPMETLNVEKYPLLKDEDPRDTLLTCSNSQYP